MSEDSLNQALRTQAESIARPLLSAAWIAYEEQTPEASHIYSSQLEEALGEDVELAAAVLDRMAHIAIMASVLRAAETGVSYEEVLADLYTHLDQIEPG